MENKTDLDEVCDVIRAEKSHVPQAEDLPSKWEWFFIVLFIIVCCVGAHWFFNSFIKGA